MSAMLKIFRPVGYVLLGVLAICSLPFVLAFYLTVYPLYVLGRSAADPVWAEKHEREHPDLDMGV